MKEILGGGGMQNQHLVILYKNALLIVQNKQLSSKNYVFIVQNPCFQGKCSDTIRECQYG